MNKIKKWGIFVTFLLVPTLSFANIELSKTELDKQTLQGNILSDSFSSLNECSTTKEKYNQEYSSYKRSDCFLNEGKYYYFICQLSNSCVINVAPTTSTTNQTVGTTTQEIPNKAKLDAFLAKVSQMRKELNNDTKYEKVLSQVENQLKTLGEKYKASTVVIQMVGYLGIGIQNIKSELSQTQYVDDFFCELLGNCGEQINVGASSPDINGNSKGNTNITTNDEYVSLISKEATQKMYTHILELVKNPPNNLAWKNHEGKQVATYSETIYQRKSTNPKQYMNFIDFYISYQEKGGQISADSINIRYAQTPINNPLLGKMKIFLPKDVAATMCVGTCSVGFQPPAAYDTIIWAFGNIPSYTFKVGDDGYPYSVSYISSMGYGASYEYGKTLRSSNGYDWKNVIYNPPNITPGWFVADKTDWLYQDYVYATKIKFPNHPAFQSVSSSDRSSYDKALELALKDNPNMNYSIDRGEAADSIDANGNPIRLGASKLLDSSYKGIQTNIQLWDKIDPKTNKKTNITLREQLENIVKNFEYGNANINNENGLSLSGDNPTLSADKTSVKAGETIIFTWNANNPSVDYCKYYINGQTDNTKLTGISGKIPIENIPAGNYIIYFECRYTSGEIKKSPMLSIVAESNTGTNNSNSSTYSNNIPSQQVTQSQSLREKTSFGILYTTLHCPGITNNGLGVRYTLGDDLVYSNPKYPQALYHWGKPALGHYCLTGPEGEQVLKEHARLLSEGGVDYIIIDATNHAYIDSRSDRTSEMIIEPTKKLLQVWSTISNAPKVVIWAPIVEGGDVYKELLQEIQKYPKLQFSYKGKPLILNAVDTARYVSDTKAIETLSKTMTVRDMWGMSGIGTKWQFMNPTGMQGPNNGEQISVSPAYQMTYMTRDTAVGKNNGETFKSQFASVFAYAGIDTVVISSWNEWASIRLQDIFDNSKAAYTDTYDEERNRDIEPQSGGKGDFYYQLMKKCISAYKSGKNSCE